MRLRKFQPPLWIFLSVLTAVPAWCQTGNKLSAREIFYSAPAVPAAKKTAPLQSAKPTEKRPVETAKSETATPPAKSGPASGNMMAVSFNPEESVPLGLRYSILKRGSTGPVEVDPDTAFRSGDRIQLRVDVNTAGYLYIINRGSSGNWKPLFPSSEVAGGNNWVQKGKRYDIPSGYVFTFDDQPGKEKLFIVFSRQPVNDLEDLIYSLSKGQSSRPGEQSRPQSNKILIAQVNIRDSLVDRLRTVYSRDLIVEKVDETMAPAPAQPEKEKAVYVVNPSSAADARLVADVTLIHQ